MRTGICSVSVLIGAMGIVIDATAVAENNSSVAPLIPSMVGAEYILNLLPRGTHDYAKFIKPSELAQSCRNAGLNLTDLTGMSYNPLSKVYSLGKSTDVNYMIACRRS